MSACPGVPSRVTKARPKIAKIISREGMSLARWFISFKIWGILTTLTAGAAAPVLIAGIATSSVGAATNIGTSLVEKAVNSKQVRISLLSIFNLFHP